MAEREQLGHSGGGAHRLIWQDQHLYLLPERAIFWQEESALLLADLHLGKAGHFRKAGIPISGQVHHHDLLKLSHLIATWQPRQVIFLGDLFHSELNQEWIQFENWLAGYPHLNFHLVKGNHDILPEPLYLHSNLQLQEAPWACGPFLFTHEPTEFQQGYNIAGHVHPAVTFTGRGRQRITLPCYFFGPSGAILPAFGRFTGTATLRPTTAHQVFAIAQDKIIPASNSH